MTMGDQEIIGCVATLGTIRDEDLNRLLSTLYGGSMQILIVESRAVGTRLEKQLRKKVCQPQRKRYASVRLWYNDCSLFMHGECTEDNTTYYNGWTVHDLVRNSAALQMPSYTAHLHQNMSLHADEVPFTLHLLPLYLSWPCT